MSGGPATCWTSPVRRNTIIGMTPQQRQPLKTRWHEIERELADLLDGKVTPDTEPATREADLLDEQDAIEFELAAGELRCGMDDSWRDDTQ